MISIFKTTYFSALILLLGCAMLVGSCSNSSRRGQEKDNDYKIAMYDLSRPAKVVVMPSDLDEISGLSYYQENKLFAVQDEVGILYTIDMGLGKVVEEKRFGKLGDYEGIAYVDSLIYCIKSNGNIYQFPLAHPESLVIMKTPLDGRNNVEGLCYDQLSNSLLIACKGSSNLKGHEWKGKVVFRVDLANKDFVDEPIMEITKGMLSGFIENDDIQIRPSGIAIHPQTHNIFVLSSKDRLLMELNRENEVVDVAVLDGKLFRQPEGLCFAPNGDLYISSEGDGKEAIVAFFEVEK